MMITREFERKYNEMKLSYKNLVNANVDLVDENKMLKGENERLNNIVNELKEVNKKYSQQLDDYWNRIEKAIEIIDIYGTSSWEIADRLYCVLRGDK